jgi:hypothetical protein
MRIQEGEKRVRFGSEKGPEGRVLPGAADRFLAIVFCLIITLPGAKMLVTPPATKSLTEKRTLAPLPPLRQLLPFPRGGRRQELKAFVNDHFGFRSELVALRADLLVYGFNVSPVPRVVLGRDYWLYVGGEGRASELPSSCEEQPFNDDELVRIRRAICKRRDWARDRGAHFLLVVPPNKATIYPENLPPEWTGVVRRTGLDQVLDDLRTHSDIAFLDFRPSLREEKQLRPVYYRTDSHWNRVGAAIVSREIATRLRAWFPDIPDLSLGNYQMESRPGFLGDLSLMLGLIPPLTEEEVEVVPNRSFRATRVTSLFEPPRYHAQGRDGVITTSCPDLRLPSGLILRDSFFEDVVPLLSECFRTCTYVWSNQIPESADGMRPDVVVFEIAERAIGRLRNDEDPILNPPW